MKQVIKTRFKFKMFVDPHDQVISRRIKKKGFYDRKGSQIIQSTLKKNDIIVNIGAHIGYFSLMAALKVGNGGHVFAFEPAPVNFHLLLKNIKLNKFKNITAIRLAILDKKKKTNLYFSDTNTGDHRVFNSGDHRKYIEVDAVSLDEFFDKRNKNINFIKIDVQGSEIKVLEGMKEILKKKNLKMYVEFWPYGLTMNGDNPKQLLDLLLENGFKIVSPVIKIRDLLNKYTLENRRFENLFCIKGN